MLKSRKYRELFIADSHNDFLTNLAYRAQFFDYCVELYSSGVRLVSSAIFTTGKGLSYADFIGIHDIMQEMNSREQVRFLLSFEDIGFIKNLTDLENIITLHPVSCTLTWNEQNILAGGALSNGNITRLGEKVIQRLERANIFIDTAHLNRKSFWQFVRLTNKPIYNSHANVDALHRHRRNLTDRQIGKIVESNGYIGITIYDEFVAGDRVDSRKIAEQFDYLIRKFGYRHFGFGTDFYGIDREHCPIDIHSYRDLYKVAERLKALGHSEQVIRAIFFDNFHDFLIRNGIL